MGIVNKPPPEPSSERLSEMFSPVSLQPTPPWRSLPVAEAHTYLIERLIEANLNERFAGYPHTRGIEREAQNIILRVLESFPERHYDYQALDHPVEGLLVQRRHVGYPQTVCPFHPISPVSREQDVAQPGWVTVIGRV